MVNAIKNILVDSDLLSIRDAAVKGELPAMITLARHLVERDQAASFLVEIETLCIAIKEHANYLRHPENQRDYYKLMADMTSLNYEAERISEAEYMQQMRHYLQELVKCTVAYPPSAWHLYELKHTVDWLYETQDWEDPTHASEDI